MALWQQHLLKWQGVTMALIKDYKIDLQPIKSYVDLQLYHYGYQECDANHSWGPGVKDHYKIHIIFEGKGLYRLGDKTYQLTAGQAFLTTPETIAHYQADPEEPWTYAWFAFDGLKAKNYLERAGLSLAAPIIEFSPEALKMAYQWIQSMLELDLSQPGKDLFRLSHLYQLLGLVIGQMTQSVREVNTSAKNLYLKSAFNYVEMNYSRKMSCEEMAHHIGIHRKYLARLFKESLETTPQAYLMTYRMEKAKQLLEGTFLSVSEVAVSVGYSDPLIFSKAFKKYCGAPPSAFSRR